MQTNDKLREALERILSVCADAEVTDCQAREIAEDVAGAALAEPVRNCDVGIVKEQNLRHSDMGCHLCFARWTSKPYEEGGAE